MKNTELVLLPELSAIAKESKIELTKAEAYAVNYMPFMAQVNELSQPLKELDKENPTETHAKIARENRLKLVKVRAAAEDRKKADKEMILIEGKLIDSLFNTVKNVAQLTEAEYTEIEKFQERKESERKEKLKADRLELLAPYGVDTDFINLSEMPEEVFAKLLDTSKTSFEAKKEAERLAEIARIELGKKAEAERIEQQRVEAERVEAQRLENERLKKEAEVKEAELAKERAEQKRLADIAAKEQAKLKAENDRIASELRAKQEAEELANLKEKQRIEAEEVERITKEKAALTAPDKEKVNALYLAIKAIAIPEFKTAEYQKLGSEVKSGLDIILKGMIDLSKKLK